MESNPLSPLLASLPPCLPPSLPPFLPPSLKSVQIDEVRDLINFHSTSPNEYGICFLSFFCFLSFSFFVLSRLALFARLYSNAVHKFHKLTLGIERLSSAKNPRRADGLLQSRILRAPCHRPISFRAKFLFFSFFLLFALNWRNDRQLFPVEMTRNKS